MGRKKIKKGFAFRPSTEYLKATMNMPTKAKLEWLEEVNAFTYKVLSKQKRKIWEKVKQGEA